MHLIFAASWYSPENWPAIAMGVLGLGFVIFVHELGHFVVAKMCGVKCEKFYVGFDPPIKLGWGKFGIRLPSALWKKKWGETEYGIGIIPLGGYVKMLGQDDNPGRQAEMMQQAQHDSAEAAAEGETSAAAATNIKTPDQQKGSDGDGSRDDLSTEKSGTENFITDPRSYIAQTVPERMAIISAGVIMNLIFAFLFAALAFKIGVPYIRCDVAAVAPGEAAWFSRILPGDRIIEINGVKNPRFKDLRQEVILGDLEEGIPVKVERTNKDGTTEVLEYLLKPKKSEKRLQAIIGISPSHSLSLDATTPAAADSPADKVKDQLLGGDKVIKVNGQPVNSYHDFMALLAENADQDIEVTFLRETKPEDAPDAAVVTEEISVTVAPNKLRRYGLVMKMGPVAAVQPGSPAAKAGIESGDEIIKIDGKPVGDPLDLPEQFRLRAGETVTFDIKRTKDGVTKDLSLSASLRQVNWSNHLLNDKMEIPSLGIAYEVVNQVAGVKANTPAADSEIQAGDVLVDLTIVPASDEQAAKEGEIFRKFGPLPFGGAEGINWPTWIFSAQRTQPDTKIKLTVRRNGKEQSIQIGAPVRSSSIRARRGFIFVAETDLMKARDIGEALSLGWRETKYSMLAVYRFLHRLLSGGVSPKLLGGPGTILAVAGMTAKQGLASLLLFLTMLSANLAVINFLPIPVLDGGHMVFLILEGIFRRPVSEKIVIPLTWAGLFLILGLMVFVISLDVNRFVL